MSSRGGPLLDQRLHGFHDVTYLARASLQVEALSGGRPESSLWTGADVVPGAALGTKDPVLGPALIGVVKRMKVHRSLSHVSTCSSRNSRMQTYISFGVAECSALYLRLRNSAGRQDCTWRTR